MRNLGRGASIADSVELGQRGRGARGEVRQVAGEIAGIDDDGPPARQGEYERVVRTVLDVCDVQRGMRQEAGRWFHGGVPRPAD